MATVNGTALGDQLLGTFYDDVINGFAGDDILLGRDGYDTLYGGDGNDIFSGGGGEDFFIGGRGSDVFQQLFQLDPTSDDFSVDVIAYNLEEGSTQGVVVNFQTGIAVDSFGFTDYLLGANVVWGTRFADVFTGGNLANNDFESFMGLQGNDTINGGAGYDLVRYDRDARDGGIAGIVANLVVGTIRDGFGNIDRVSGIEGIRGTAQVDSFTGNAGENAFYGLAGNDSLFGGAGRDWARYDRDDNAGGLAGVVVNLATGIAKDGFGNTDSLSSIENVRATDFADNLVGNAANNFLNLDDGNDTASGGNGNDTLRGGNGADRLVGGNGNDFLLGESGLDRLTGNAGADTFYFAFASNLKDVITDFSSANDTLAFEASNFLKPVGHTLSLGVDFFLSTVANGATTSQASFIYETDAGRVWFDFDGAGATQAVLVASLVGRPVVNASDFAFIELDYL